MQLSLVRYNLFLQDFFTFIFKRIKKDEMNERISRTIDLISKQEQVAMILVATT